MADTLAALGVRASEASPTSSPATLWEQYPGMTPTYAGYDIERACEEGELSIVILLWYKGVAANKKRPDIGASLLHAAALKGHVHIIKFLVDKGAEVEVATTDTENTPIMWASIGGHLEAVKCLKEFGADPKRVDIKGYNTAFHATHFGHTDVVHHVITQYGVDPHSVDTSGHNLVQWAGYKGHLGTLRYLHEVHNVDLEKADNEQRVTLHWASMEGHDRIVEYLLSRGVKKIKVQDSSGRTPEDHARERYHHNIVKMLTSSRPVKYGSGMEESTLSLMLNNKQHLRRFLYGIILTPIVFFYVSRMIPIVLAWLALPALLVLPTVLDSTLTRRGHPSKAQHGSSAVRGELLSMATAAERNLNVFAIALSLQVLLPYYYTTSQVGQWVYVSYPSLWGALTCALSAAGIFYCLAVGKRARSPPAPRNETSVARMESGEDTVPGSFCYESMERKTLRSFYCPLINRVVSCFDHFNLTLDNAIGAGNHQLYLLWLISSSVWLGLISLTTLLWVLAGAGGLVPTVDFTFCRVIWRVATTALPTGVSSSSWLPSDVQVIGMWLFVFCGVCCLGCILSALSQLYSLSLGVTQAELKDPMCVPVRGKGLQSVVEQPKGKRLQSVYAEKSQMATLFSFFTGRYATKYEGMTELLGRDL